MTQLVEGPINNATLMQRLASAKKIMNKVESGDYSRGHIDETALVSDDVMISEEMLPQHQQPSLQERVNIRPVGNTTIERIQQSKLPDAIKQAMINSPIDQPNSISLTETLDMNFVNGVKRLMEEEGTISRGPKKQITPSPVQPQRQTQVPQQPIQTYGNNDSLVATLTPIIENIIRRTLDDIVDKKLSQILTAQQTASLNENLVLKVGDSIFRGKITGVNKVAKK